MRLRPFQKQDSKLIHDVRNQPSIAAVSHPKEVKIISHRKRDLGYIQRQKGLISIAIYSAHQGKGLGTKALKTFCKKGDEAEILWANEKSIHTFHKAGFRPYSIRMIKKTTRRKRERSNNTGKINFESISG